MSSRDLHAGLDHIGLYAEDIDGAYRQYSRLGFTVAPPSRFETQPFATCAIMLDDVYVSISGVLDWKTAPQWMQAGMGTGLQAFVLRSDDLDDVWRRIGPAGNNVLQLDGTVETITRRLDLGHGEMKASFRVLRLKRRSLPALARCNYCQHLTPETMWQPELLVHANGATRLDSVIAVHDQPRTLAGFYRDLFGNADMRDDRTLGVDCGRARLDIVTPALLAERYDGLSQPYRPGEPLLAGARIAVGDPSVAAGVLERAGIPHRVTADGVAVAAAHAYGAFIEFVQPDPSQQSSPPHGRA